MAVCGHCTLLFLSCSAASLYGIISKGNAPLWCLEHKSSGSNTLPMHRPNATEGFLKNRVGHCLFVTKADTVLPAPRYYALTDKRYWLVQ